jgi:WD40 repeat protein
MEGLQSLTLSSGEKAGEHWALAISPEGKFLATTTHDGRVNVYDTSKINEEVKAAQTLAQFETKGSFGTCVDIVCCLHLILKASTTILTIFPSPPVVE